MTFTVASLCRNQITKSRLLEELGRATFAASTAVCLFDHSQGQHDCYTALMSALLAADSEYLVWLHDDITFDGLTACDLQKALESVIQRDPSAAVFGVAGKRKSWFKGFGHLFCCGREELWGSTEKPMASLDECFLVIRNGFGVRPSVNIDGYHFYGADLCLQAKRLGMTAHVIEFPVHHHSAGKLDESFCRAKTIFEKQMLKAGINCFLPTTCAILYGGTNRLFKAISNYATIRIARHAKHRDESYVREHFSRSTTEAYGRIITVVARASTIVLFMSYRIPCLLRGGFRRIFREAVWWRKNWRSRLFSTYAGHPARRPSR